MKKLTKLKKLYTEYIRLKKETENEPTVLISPKGLQYINPVFLQMMQMRKELREILKRNSKNDNLARNTRIKKS